MPSLQSERVQPDLPFVPPLLRRLPLKRVGADVAYLAIALSCWTIGNLLALLGCVVAMFLVISHGNIDVFFSHLNNLASRYVAADLGRRAAFQHQLVWGFSIMAVIFFAVRLPRFVIRLRKELAEGPRP
ncbi:hypothetical protein [Sphingomonas sp. TZW2008]|uniref:hypothetical protein n=1 Tax=Sphingomonas sp. TZW2008 TaxID=1917973 RepID=UPI000A26FB8F|nr:hypothetical protein [Sphingomonas sp. TZW2008]